MKLKPAVDYDSKAMIFFVAAKVFPGCFWVFMIMGFFNMALHLYYVFKKEV